VRIIVVGCSRVGADLAYRLYQQGHEVAVVDEDAAAFDDLPSDYRGRTVEGEALSRNVLRAAGIEHAEGLAAVSNSDALNVVVAHVARTVFQVPYVVVRNHNPRWRPLYEVFGLQVVSPTSWDVQRVEELLTQSSPRTVFSAGHGEVELYEFLVSASWDGRALDEIFPADGCQVVAITRAGRAMLPDPAGPLQVGDVAHVSATPEVMERLRQHLEAGQEG